MADWKKVEQALGDDALEDVKKSEKKPATKSTKGATKKPSEKSTEKAAPQADKKPKNKAAEKPEAKKTAVKEVEKKAAETTAPKKTKAEKDAEKEKKKKEKLIAYGRKLRAREAERNARVSKYGNRRGRYKWAAPVGFLMSLLAVIGVIAVVATGVGMVRDLADDTVLREEIYYFLQPLTTYNPVPDFLDINEEDHDALMRAAVWRITEAERVRMLREKDDNTAYELDNNGRLIVPVTEVEAEYKYLFGDAAVLKHRTLGEDDVEYSESNSCYYIPFNFISSLHQPVIDTIRRRGDEYQVRVAYVSVNDLEVDEHGNTVDPTPDMADFTQIFVLKRVDGHFTVTAVGSEA